MFNTYKKYDTNFKTIEECDNEIIRIESELVVLEDSLKNDISNFSLTQSMKTKEAIYQLRVLLSEICVKRYELSNPYTDVYEQNSIPKQRTHIYPNTAIRLRR